MTMTRLFRVGDRVRLAIDPETRKWVEGLPEDGLTGTIRAFYHYERYRELFGNDMALGYVPGIYQSEGRPEIEWDVPLDLKAHQRVKGHRVEMVDQDEYERRYREEWLEPVIRNETVDSKEQDDYLTNTVYISKLPETGFYPLDKVKPVDAKARELDHPDNVLVIHSRKWEWLDHSDKPDLVYDATEYADYDTDDPKSYGSLMLKESELVLVERGPVWAHYNDDSYTFHTLRQEIAFASGMGRMTQVRNPNTGNYTWTQKEFEVALQEGIIDSVQVSRLFANPMTLCHRCTDRELGERLRHETMQGFNLV